MTLRVWWLAGALATAPVTPASPASPARDASLPACLTRAEDQPTADAVPTSTPDDELLARLVLAEATSTGSPDDPLVVRGIAWGAANRVALAARSRQAASSYGRGVRGVVFQRGQFNPAVSTRSPFGRLLLCPDDPGRWGLALAAAREALAGSGNPFVQTPWEAAHGLSLVVNFYYPASIQARGPLAPWEGSSTLTFVGDVPMGGSVLSAEKVRFYRLSSPPADVSP